jgi:anaerobic magnesium-protoporphyrin IX monomethyl ester cyclase
MQILYIRPPRRLWPFIGEKSSFWPPLAFICLAAQVRRELPSVRQRLIDCTAEKIGWKSLEKLLVGETPDVVAIGEEMVSAGEGIRLAGLVRRIHPDSLIVAGGPFFSAVAEPALRSGLFDVIVHGEGEITFVEWLNRIRDGRWDEVAGLSFKRDEKVIHTPHRPLIDNLDELPLPVYDLAPMYLYGRGSCNHPALAAVEHSRGCFDTCNFCILWRHMGESNGDGRIAPRYRTKSAERSLKEAELLVNLYGRQTLVWADPTWNGSAEWTAGFADGVLRNGWKLQMTAWCRAEAIIRDEKAGILEQAVKAGLNEVIIGIERPEPQMLGRLNKHGNGPEIVREALAILREKYPEVYVIGSVIYGLPDETNLSLRRLADYTADLACDDVFHIPITPHPGTRIFEDAVENGWLESGNGKGGDWLLRNNWERFNFHTVVAATKQLSPRQVEDRYYFEMIRAMSSNPVRWLSELFRQPTQRKRRVQRRLQWRGAKVFLRWAGRKYLHSRDKNTTFHGNKPFWYDR